MLVGCVRVRVFSFMYIELTFVRSAKQNGTKGHGFLTFSWFCQTYDQLIRGSDVSIDLRKRSSLYGIWDVIFLRVTRPKRNKSSSILQSRNESAFY